MDSSNLSIFCPEHNQYVQQVCLINNCYQKLLCDICMKKHKDIHKNQQMPLIEFINHLKVFQSIKLEEGEDLSSLQEQVRGGQRVLRGSDGKQSQVQYLMLSCLNGKELEAKTNLFSDKATKKKSSLQEKEVKDFTNGIQTFIQTQQRKILQFEKNMMESMTNQLKRATSRRVLDEKYLKDSAISVILDDLKNNNTTRYNELSKNLQKLHKGFLELKVSKKIFRDMCADTQSRFRVFSRNLSQFFDNESNKLFAFMFDVNEEITKQNVLDQALGNNKDIDSGSGNNNNLSTSAMIASPTQKSFHDLKLSLVHDPNHPNIQMTKMILDLETINKQTKIAAHPQEIYPPDIQIPMNNNNNSSLNQANSNNNSLSGSVQFLKDNSQQESKSQPKINKYQQAELLKRLDYQKKEYKVNLEKTECLRFNIIKTNCMMISSENQSFFGDSQQLSLKQQTYLYQAPSLMNAGNDQNNMSVMISSQNTSSINPNNSSSVQAFITPNKKSANFRIHSSTKSQINVDSPDSSLLQSNNPGGAMSSRPISVHFQSPMTSSSRQVSFSQQLDQSKPLNMNGKSNILTNSGTLKSNLSSIQLNIPSALINPGYRDHTQQFGIVSPTPPAKKKIINLQIECDFKSCNLLTAVTNPSLRALGFLEQLKLTSSNLANPLSRKTIAEQSNIKSVTIQNSSLLKLTKDIPDPLQQAQLETTKQPSQFIIGIESVSPNKVMLVQQNGTISVWQINGQLSSQKIKEQQLCKNIQSYVEVLKRDKNSMKNHNSNNSTLSSSSLDSFDSEDLLLFVCGQNESDGTTTTSTSTTSAALYILKYEGKKNRFFCIDTLKESKLTQHAPLSPLKPPTMITCVEAAADKLFKKNNLPTSLQLITDAYFLYQLNLFDYDIDAGIDHTPTISVHRVSFHKEKYGSSEKSLITRIKIKPEVMIQKIIFDELNDCLWGHSDYMLFKWRVNVMSKCLETQDAITLCTKTSDIITSMILNEQIIMLTSLSGNIWGIDVMFNKAIDKDCERFKYAAINKYNKIQGKDPIAILAGSRITALRKIKRINSSDDAFKSIKVGNNNANNNTNNTSNINDSSNNNNNSNNTGGFDYQLDTFFVYSTLSQAGAKLFCFDKEFKEVVNTISGQQNHIQQTIALGGDSFLVAQEDFDCLRVWKNDFF